MRSERRIGKTTSKLLLSRLDPATSPSRYFTSPSYSSSLQPVKRKPGVSSRHLSISPQRSMQRIAGPHSTNEVSPARTCHTDTSLPPSLPEPAPQRVIWKNKLQNLRQVISHQWTAHLRAYQTKNPDFMLKGFFYVTLAFTGFIVDRWLKSRAENLAILNEIRELVEKQDREIRELLAELPDKESHLGFYLYASPSQEKLAGINKQIARLHQLIEQNRRLQERLGQLNLRPWIKEAREDYRQATRLQQELSKQAKRLRLALSFQQAIEDYVYQRFEAALEKVKLTFSELEPYQLALTEKKADHLTFSPFEARDIDTLSVALYHLKAKTLRVLKDIQGTIHSYQAALEICQQPSSFIPDDRKATLLSDYGLFISEEASYKDFIHVRLFHEEALAFHQQAYALNPHDAFVIGNYARGMYLQAIEINDLSQRQQQLERAHTLLSRAVELKPNYATLRLYRGIVRMELAKRAPTDTMRPLYQLALADFDAGLKEQPQHTSLLCRRALVQAYLAETTLKQKEGAAYTTEKAILDLTHLKGALTLKQDWLEGVDSKLAAVETLKESISNHEMLDCQQRDSGCKAIARFFYHRKNKAAPLLLEDRVSHSHPSP